MELNYILTWLVAASTLLQGFTLWMQVRWRARGWYLAIGGTLAALGLAYLIVPEHAGIVATPVWMLAVLIPAVGTGIARRLMAAGRYRAARPLARLVALLHPSDGIPELPVQCTALAALDASDLDTARTALERLAKRRSMIGIWATAILLLLDRDWLGFKGWFERQPPLSPLHVNPQTRSGYLRALGELGLIDDMVEAWQRLAKHPTTRMARAAEAVSVLAYAGRTRAVEQCLQGPLAWEGPRLRELALAVAEQASGATEAARQRLQTLLDEHEVQDVPRWQIEARMRDTAPVADPTTWRDTTREAVDELAIEASIVAKRGPGTDPRKRGRTPATWGLVLVLAVVFAFEVPGGSTDLQNLFELGMLVVPMEVTPGEWWRVITAGFLHYGPLHFALNSLGLVFFGRGLERALGSWRLLILFLVSNLAGVLSVALLVDASPDAPVTLVGASGGVMGVLGGLTVTLLAQWRRQRNARLKNQLVVLVAVIGLQILFDSLTPIVSQQAHLGGLIVGAVLAVVLRPRERPSDGAVASESTPD